MESSSTDKPSPSPAAEPSTSETPATSTLSADRLRDLEELVKTLAARLSSCAVHSAKLEREANRAGEGAKTVEERLFQLEKKYADHIMVNDKWWRKSLAAMQTDIDRLRSQVTDSS